VLADVFAIDGCDNAVMSIDSRLMIGLGRLQADGWDSAIVAEHWLKLFFYLYVFVCAGPALQVMVQCKICHKLTCRTGQRVLPA
jgi:hypothetical protein